MRVANEFSIISRMFHFSHWKWGGMELFVWNHRHGYRLNSTRSKGNNSLAKMSDPTNIKHLSQKVIEYEKFLNETLREDLRYIRHKARVHRFCCHFMFIDISGTFRSVNNTRNSF